MSRPKARGGANAESRTYERKRPLDSDASDVKSENKRPKRSEKSVTTTKDGNTSPRPSKQAVYEVSIAKESPEELAERFTAAIKKHKGDLSTIELEDQSLPVKAFRDTTDFAETRVATNLASFLENNCERGEEELKEGAEGKGTPHTILLSSSAIRIQGLLPEVRKYGSEQVKIAKLYAKHFKMKDAVSYVQQNRFGIGGGTAGRVEQLIKQDVLKLDDLKRIVVDGSFVDEKQRTIFTDRDAFLSILSLLNLDQLKLRLISGNTEILVF